MGKRRRRREQQREEAEERAVWLQAAEWRPTEAQAEWSRAKAALRDAEDKLRRAVEGEREQAASDWQDAQLRLQRAQAALQREQAPLFGGSEFDDDMSEGLVKAYRRKVRRETLAYVAPRAALLVAGAAAIVGAVVALVND
jgi:hypothetical protein